MSSDNKTYGVSDVLVPYLLPEHKSNGIMIVAEAPGETEEERQLPLVGVSGEKFNEWLKKVGIHRKELIIGNTFRYRPGQNHIDHFFCSTKYAKENEVEVSSKPKYNGLNLIKYFEPELEYLHKTIAKHKPKVVIAMGGVATWALLDISGITTLQGKVFKKKFKHEKAGSSLINILPSFHPAAAVSYRDNDGVKEKAIISVFKHAKSLVE